jgi:type I restriction enzyme, S subunit
MIRGWKFKKLGSVCKTGAGGTPLKSHKEYYANGTIPWIRSGEVNNKNITESEIKITDLGLNNSSAKLFPPRTVVIAMYGATAGEVGILNFECASNQAVCGILPNENFIPEFLYYFFLKFKADLIAQAVGNAQPNISQAKIKDTLVPVISIYEQQQIVTLLDDTFEAIDQAKANIEKNIANAQELFQSKLNDIFSQKGEGWAVKKLKEVCKTGAGGTPLKSKMEYYDGGDIPWIRSGEVNNRNIVDSEIKITQEGLDNSSAKLFPPRTVVVAMYGATAGQVGILNFECSSNQAVCGILPNDRFIPEFLYYKFLDFKEALVSQAVGGAQPNISQAKIKETLIPLISIHKQKSIVKTLDNLSFKTEKVIASYNCQLINLQELKKSILQKAFAGELTNKGVEV